MRAILVLCLAVVLAQARSDYAAMFTEFKATYNRQYANAAEEAHRFRVFAHNMEKAQQHQSTNPLATFGVNEFADVTAAEFKRRHNSERIYKAQRDARLETRVVTAEEKKVAAGQQQDWRPKGAVTPVKNQGQCGSCWSFSTTGGIEGQWFLAGNKLTSLSEQELVSCDTIDSGCNGGLMTNAFQWLINAKNGSIVTESSYPYVSGNGNVPACSLAGKKFGARIDGFKKIEANEDAMAAFVYSSGPLSIAVDATSWQSYTGGIMTNCISQQIDHGVLIVGFDDTNTPPYWIIKNSWAKSWGEEGYIRVQKGTDQCLITSLPCTSEVKKSGPTPAPGPTPSAGGTWTQKTCIDRKCQKCSSMTFEQNTCITGVNASYNAFCIANGIVVSAYKSRDCSGDAVTTVNPINQCSIIFRKTGDERFVQNMCEDAPKPTSAPTSAPTSPPGPSPPPAPTPAPTFPSGWINLFAPPFSNVPTITMAIAAVDKTVSYVPGGENGAGFTTFEFNNQENGQFTPLVMPDMALMILAIAAGGTAKEPKGIVGGIGIGNGVQYFVNSTTLLPSKIPTLLVQTQDARMSRDGKQALVVDGASNSVLYSADSGATFNEKPIKVKMPNANCTGARYAAMVDANTYYVTLGSWPSNNNNQKDVFHVTEAMTATRHASGKVTRKMTMPASASENVGSGSSSGHSSGSSNNQCAGYTALLVKTTDGGNTWEAQVNPTNPDYYFNAIDCVSATHCIAVGEGFNQGAGGHIFQTTDGKTWKQVFFAESGAQGQYSFMSVRFVGTDGKQAWVGGSLMVSQVQSGGVFYHTADGGATWKLYPHGIPDLGAVSNIDFLPDGIGFATAMTTFDDSTILRYDPSGPPPPGYFIQSQCPSAGCSFLCQNASFPEDMCLPLNGGGSALAKCTTDSLDQSVYQTSDCTGSFNVTKMPLDKCLNDNGSYFENYCPKNQAHRMPPTGRTFRSVRP